MPLITHWVGRNLNSKRDLFFFFFSFCSVEADKPSRYESSSRLTEARGFRSIDKYIDECSSLELDLDGFFAGVINDRLNKFRRFIKSRLKQIDLYAP